MWICSSASFCLFFHQNRTKHKKRKDSFCGSCTGNTSKQQKMAASSEYFLSEDDFEGALTTFCCYVYGANSSETVTKIATD